MARSKLKVKKRLRLGKSGAREVRKEGNVPAILYGKGKEPLPLVINPGDLKTALSTESGRNTLLDLEIEGDDNNSNELSLLRDIQVDYLSAKPIHLDLLSVDMKEKLDVRVPLKINGRAEGLKEGGMLEVLVREISMKCIPDNIPNSIEVEVTPLQIGDSIHVGDLDLPEGVEALIDEEEPVLTVIMPKGMTTETVLPEDEEGDEGEESAKEGEEKEGEQTAESEGDER